MALRHFWLLFHRYAGLFMALWLLVIGITGSIIVFNPELRDWLTPAPRVAIRADGELPPIVLQERAQALMPGASFNMVMLHHKPGEAFMAMAEPGAAAGSEPAFAYLYLDPYTGAEVAREPAHDELWPIGAGNVLNLVNQLHYKLALPGEVGVWLFGIVALVWTVDCFVSAYLTFPRRTRRGEGAGAWLRRWWNPSWLVQGRGSAYRLNFDLHRAGGLWLWLMLLAFAWSGVGFNLPGQVYMPAMRAALAMPDPYGDLQPALAAPRPRPPLPWSEAYALGRRLMEAHARSDGFRVEQDDFLMYMPDKGTYLLVSRTDHDLWDEDGGTTLVFDAEGKVRSLFVPTGLNAGATLHSWIFALHMAKIWGLPFRIFVTVMGVVVAALSATGVYIWWKKRRARRSLDRAETRQEDGVVTIV